MQAISQTRKAAVKKLGITLSDAPEPSPKAKSTKKAIDLCGVGCLWS